MKTSQIVFSALSLALILSLASCVKDNFDGSVAPDPDGGTPETPEVPVDELEITELQIPSGFEFETDKEVQLIINDNTPNVKYDVYA